MQRQHLVPQMLLRRFADERTMLRASPRSGGAAVTMTVRRACKEIGFYDIELHPDYSHLMPRNQVEESLSAFEGRASAILDRFVQRDPDFTSEDRYNLLLFVAFQMVRGWSFRRELSELATLAAWQFLESEVPDERIRDYLDSLDSPADDASVDAFRRSVVEGSWRIEADPSHAVQEMVDTALNRYLPELFEKRRVQVLEFDEPMLLIGDEPVVLWSPPGRDGKPSPVGVANAEVIYMPIDRRHLLALALDGCEGFGRAPSELGVHVNGLVARAASRWVFQHPDDDAYPIADLTDPPRWTIETLGATVDGETVRVQKRYVRR